MSKEKSYFGYHDIPKRFGTCPACGSPLLADVYEVTTSTGRPTETGFHIHCANSYAIYEKALEKAIETNFRGELESAEQCDWDYEDCINAMRKASRYFGTLPIIDSKTAINPL